MRRLFDPATTSFSTPSNDELARRLAEKKLGFWLDIEAPDDEDFAALGDVFKFHQLTIEDVRHQNQRPKFDEFKAYDFMVVFSCSLDGDQITYREHHLYLAHDFLVTVHQEPEPALKRVGDRLKEGDLRGGEVDFVTYLVLDGLVDQVFDVLDDLDTSSDDLQDRVLRRATPESLTAITGLRHEISSLRRNLSAERDMLQRLLTHALQVHDQEMTLYFRDIYDHLVRQYEQADSIRDLLSGAMDVYLSTVSNRLNETMRALTAIASLFLPLTFLTGFFGQNFGFLVSRIGSPSAFAVGLSVMAASVVLQLVLFRRRGWI